MGVAIMNTGKAKWSQRYQTALRNHLTPGPRANPRAAQGLGREAVTLGLQTLDVAKSHEQALTTVRSPGGSSGTRRRTIERAQGFFAETIVPIERTHRAALKADVRVHQLTRTLRRRTLESSASIRCLKRIVLLRRGAEQALKKSGKRHAGLRVELHRLRNHLRDLTHTCLSSQEDERRRMSLQLHDEVAQALIAIGLRLLALKKAAEAGTGRLKKEIASTQRLVKESDKRINCFAHEFRIRHET
jgi:signal transduction histidine kinase